MVMITNNLPTGYHRDFQLLKENIINAFEDVLIEENVLIAENVFLGDADHRVTDPDIAIINQGHVLKPGTIIGTGSFIARNAVLSGGVKLGKNCLVGANSVLKKRTYKNNTLIYGNPLKVVNNYNSKMNLFKQWIGLILKRES